MGDAFRRTASDWSIAQRCSRRVVVLADVARDDYIEELQPIGINLGCTLPLVGNPDFGVNGYKSCIHSDKMQ